MNSETWPIFICYWLFPICRISDCIFCKGCLFSDNSQAVFRTESLIFCCNACGVDLCLPAKYSCYSCHCGVWNYSIGFPDCGLVCACDFTCSCRWICWLWDFTVVGKELLEQEQGTSSNLETFNILIVKCMLAPHACAHTHTLRSSSKIHIYHSKNVVHSLELNFGIVLNICILIGQTHS